MTINYLFLLIAILSTAIGQFFYKKYALTSNRDYYYLAILLFLSAPVASFVALQKISIDIVYMSTALTIFIVLLLSKIFLKEVITGRMYTGVFLIIFGVLVYGY